MLLGKVVDCRVGAEESKMNLEQSVVPDTEEVLLEKKEEVRVKRPQGPT